MHSVKGSVGIIGQSIALIGLCAGLAACVDNAASTASSATSATVAAPSTTSGTSGTTTSSTSSTSSSTSSSSNSSAAAAQAVTLSWAAPTENTDGSALTNLAGFDIYYGTSSSSLTQKITLNSVGLLTYVVENLNSGTWYFEVVAVNSSGVRSGPSSVVSVTI